MSTQPSPTPLSAAQIATLAKLDTPTVCNALELLDPKSFESSFTHRPLVCAFPELPSIVGYACTATIRARRPSGEPPAERRKLRFAWFDYIAATPAPRICVLQDLDEPVGFGAFWGEVQSNVHKALGCAGVVTNGSVRDLHIIAPGFQLLAGSVGPSHAYVHLVEFGVQVEVAEMTVKSGDLIHADRHGAVVIPHHLAREVVGAADKCARKEAIILGAAKSPNFSVQALKDAITKAEDSSY